MLLDGKNYIFCIESEIKYCGSTTVIITEDLEKAIPLFIKPRSFGEECKLQIWCNNSEIGCPLYSPEYFGTIFESVVRTGHIHDPTRLERLIGVINLKFDEYIELRDYLITSFKLQLSAGEMDEFGQFD